MTSENINSKFISLPMYLTWNRRLLRTGFLSITNVVMGFKFRTAKIEAFVAFDAVAVKAAFFGREIHQ